jgi:hypothetical protein
MARKAERKGKLEQSSSKEWKERELREEKRKRRVEVVVRRKILK